MRTLSLPFLLCILFLKPLVFGEMVDFQQYEQKISQTIYLTHGIMAQSPEIIKCQDGEKVYIDEQFVEKNDDPFGGMIHIDTENHVYLPLLLSDEFGYYTSILREFWTKAFHQKCNNCGFEWEAEWYEFKCRNCGSRDYRNVPSW